MPAYSPVFNLMCSGWRPPNVPPAPSDYSLQCQLYIASRGLIDITPGNPALWVPPIYLRVPPFSDIRPDDIIECPLGSGRLYSVRWVEDLHKGFPNEYRVGVLEQTFQPFPLP